MERAFELGFLAVTASLPLRILAMQAARRELRARPRHALVVVLLALIAVAIVGWAALRSPPILRVISVAAGGVAGLALWRAHSRYGSRRSLPPGSLGLTASLRAIVDRSFYTEKFRRHGPVFKMSQFHNPVVCIASIAVGRELLKREAGNLELPPMTVSALSPKGFLRYMEPGDYAQYAPLFRAAFTDQILAESRGLTREAARRELTALSNACAGSEAPGVDPRPALRRFLFGVLMRIYFGDQLEPKDHKSIEEWCRAIGATSALGGISDATREAVASFQELLGESGGPRGPGGTVWGNILGLDPGAAADPTTTANLLILIEASRDSIGGLLTWSVKQLAAHPEWLEAIRRDSAGDSNAHPGPGSTGGTTPGVARANDTATSVVLETLRLAQSEYVYRTCARPIALAGFRIPKGWFLRICVAEAHRTDPPFEDPDAFRPDRHQTKTFSSRQFAPFGLDRHACLGARMSLFVGREFVDVLGTEFDLRQVDDGEPERGNRHWLHWEPSGRLRVVVSRAHL
jgi:cytochrome P450